MVSASAARSWARSATVVARGSHFSYPMCKRASESAVLSRLRRRARPNTGPTTSVVGVFRWQWRSCSSPDQRAQVTRRPQARGRLPQPKQRARIGAEASCRRRRGAAGGSELRLVLLVWSDELVAHGRPSAAPCGALPVSTSRARETACLLLGRATRGAVERDVVRVELVRGSGVSPSGRDRVAGCLGKESL